METYDFFSSPSKWCIPVIIFVILAIYSVAAPLLSQEPSTKKRLYRSLIALISALIMYIILQALCQSGNEMWAWILLLAPYILLGVIVAIYGEAIMRKCKRCL